MAEHASITSIEVRPGGLVLTLDGGMRVRAVPWSEIEGIIANPAEIVIMWAPTAEERERARLDAVGWGDAALGDPERGGYWPGEETMGTADDDWVKPARKMRRRIMRAWRRWARTQVGG